MANFVAGFWILFALLVLMLPYVIWVSMRAFSPATASKCRRMTSGEWRAPPDCKVCSDRGSPAATPGICSCHARYAGHLCDVCAKGYIRSEWNGECVPE